MKNTLKKLRTGVMVTLAGASFMTATVTQAEETTVSSTPTVSNPTVESTELANAQAEVATAQAEVATAQANFDTAQAELAQATTATPPVEITDTAIQEAQVAYDNASAEVDSLTPIVNQAQSDVATAQNEVASAQTAVSDAGKYLAHVNEAEVTGQAGGQETPEIQSAREAVETAEQELKNAEFFLARTDVHRETYENYKNGGLEFTADYSKQEDDKYLTQPNKLDFTPTVGEPIVVDLGTDPANASHTTADLTTEAIKVITEIRKANGLPTELYTNKAIQDYAEFRLREVAEMGGVIEQGAKAHKTSNKQMEDGNVLLGENLAVVNGFDLIQNKSNFATVIPSMLAWMTDYYNVTGSNYGHARPILTNNSSSTYPVTVAYANDGKNAILVYGTQPKRKYEETYESTMDGRLTETTNPVTGKIAHRIDGKQVVLPAPYHFKMVSGAMTHEEIKRVAPLVASNYEKFYLRDLADYNKAVDNKDIAVSTLENFLAEHHKTNIESARANATAELDTAKTRLATAQAKLATAQAELVKAEQAKANARAKEIEAEQTLRTLLANKQANNSVTTSPAVANAPANTSAVVSAQAKVLETQTQLEKAKANLASAQARLETARQNATRVSAPSVATTPTAPTLNVAVTPAVTPAVVNTPLVTPVVTPTVAVTPVTAPATTQPAVTRPVDGKQTVTTVTKPAETQAVSKPAVAKPTETSSVSAPAVSNPAETTTVSKPATPTTTSTTEELQTSKGESVVEDEKPAIHLVSETAEGTTAKGESVTADEKPAIHLVAETAEGVTAKGESVMAEEKPVVHLVAETAEGVMVKGEGATVDEKPVGLVPTVAPALAEKAPQKGLAAEQASGQPTYSRVQRAAALPQTGDVASMYSLLGLSLSSLGVVTLNKRRNK